MLSMTGYGRGHVNREERDMLVELKAVNHRFLDVSYRIPKTLAFLEEPLRMRMNDCGLKRGHIDVTVTYQNNRPDAVEIMLDRPLLSRCAAEIREIASLLQSYEPTTAELIQLCGGLRIAQAEEDATLVAGLAMEAFELAFKELQAMREREGAALAADLATNQTQAEALLRRIESRAPSVPVQYRDRLTAKLAEWSVQGLEPQRIAQEVALLADKCAVDEELSRLKSHFGQFAECLTDGGEVGRRMDFLLQEMNRETNTIGSKASDADIAQRVVEMKCILEKLREQVQNIV